MLAENGIWEDFISEKLALPDSWGSSYKLQRPAEGEIVKSIKDLAIYEENEQGFPTKNKAVYGRLNGELWF